MFTSLTIHGAKASVLWGYHTAAELSSWRIFKRPDGHWMLTGTVARAEPFQCRKSPLLFTAPREKGWWAWGIEGDVVIERKQFSARLGPPEQ